MSNLFSDYGTEFELMRRSVMHDPLGGYVTVWEPYIEFVGSMHILTSTEVRIAEAQGLKTIYLVAVDVSLPIFQSDVFRRKSDGMTFRATSNTRDNKTPSKASVPNAQFTAEEWAIPAE